MDPWKVVVVPFSEDGVALNPEELGRKISVAFNTMEAEGRDLLAPSTLGDQGVMVVGLYREEVEEEPATEGDPLVVEAPCSTVKVQSHLSLSLVEQTMSLLRSVDPAKEEKAVSHFLSQCLGQWSIPQMQTVLSDLLMLRSANPEDKMFLKVLTYTSSALKQKLRLHLQ